MRKPFRPALAALALAFALPAVAGSARAQDAPAKKDKKKEKDAPETPLLSSEAQGLLDALSPRIDAEQWVDVLAAAREIVDKHAQEIVFGEQPESPSDVKKGVLHVPAGTALRRRLAGVSPEGRAELVRLAADDPDTRLESARASLDPGRLVDTADRYFFALQGGEALLEAGDLYAERGSLIAASFAWHEVLEFHPSNVLRTTAARRLVGLLPLLGDAGTARALRRQLRHTLEWDVPTRDALLAMTKTIAGELDKLDVPDQCVTSSGAIAPLGSAIWPTKVRHKHSFEDEVSKELDWRAGDITRVEQCEDGQFLPGIRRILTGSAVTEDWLIVHLGRQIYLYDTHEESQPIKVGKKNLMTFLKGLRRATVLARYGLALDPTDDGTACYATIRTGPILSTVNDPIPLGALVKFMLPDSSDKPALVELTWPKEKEAADEEDGGPRRRSKKKDAAPQEGAEDVLSFVGTPLPSGDRVFCGAYLAGAPNQTFVAAVDAATGTLIWKRALATTDSFQTAVQQWEAPVSRPVPSPTLSFAEGALIVLSNNGCIAAIEPEDGRLIWARSYEREANERGSRTPWNHPPEEIVEAQGYGSNPVLALADVGVACPQDSQKTHLVRLSTGEGLSVKPRKTEGQGTYRFLLGNWGGRIVLEGDGWIATYDLTEDNKTGKIELSAAWQVALDSHRRTGCDFTRGFLAGKWALIPHEKLGLLAFDVTSDDSKDARAEILDWKKPANEMGDLVVGEGRFATVSARYAHLYQVKKTKKVREEEK